MEFDSAKMFDLSGRVAIVTGCGDRSIGCAIADVLAQYGADIVGVARREMPQARALVEAHGRRFLEYRFDLQNTDRLGEVLDAATGAFGHADILVNSAGISDNGNLVESYPPEQFDRIINLNQTALIKLSMIFFKYLVERGVGGKILNISSGMAVRFAPDSLAYSTSKCAINGATKQMSVAGMPHGICVNAIAPGFVDTPINDKHDPKMLEYMAEYRIPARRLGTPDDLKGAALFFCSSASDYIGGQILYVDGASCHAF